MILTNLVEIPTNNRNYKRFEKLGYKFKVGDRISVSTLDLSECSPSKILVRCDICGIEKSIKFGDYGKNTSNGGYYACSRICGNDKLRISNLKRYVTEYPLQNEDIKNKAKVTTMGRYGVEYAQQSNQIQDKSKKSKLDRYGDENYNNHDRNNQTKFEKYGDENYNNQIKSKETKLEKYGDENYNNRPKCRETCLEKYGFVSPMQNKDIKDKIKEYFILEYGVDHPMKNAEVYRRLQKSSYRISFDEESGLYYRGTYELDFIKYCIKNNIKIKEGIVIDYNMDNRDRKYYSDFFIEEYNLICEIKSSYTFDYDHRENLIKKDSSIKSGYNFIFIIDKNYIELEKIIKTNGKYSFI